MDVNPAGPAPFPGDPAAAGREAWLRDRAAVQARQDHIVGYVRAAVDRRQDPTGDVWTVLGDVVATLDRIRCGPTVGPDGQDWAATAISDLARLWLDDDQVDELYLTGTVAGQTTDQARHNGGDTR